MARRPAGLHSRLPPTHRDQPGQGCPTAALAQDIARTGTTGTRQVLADGVNDLARWLDTDDQSGLMTACTMLGALLIARATQGTPLSDQVLEQVRGALTDAR
ncbi:hypothetical protein GCM10008959_20330 [Deinococcus seoulensis]|uniref:TetR family transcriptional regulator n=1 Tax=Deinococcus seoulensis TaxID=1837379 RepID=A0ABQ2RVG0_9DEIO|nr:hypothetical protein [Deinococcus seoulensis]GGR58574.1 hypothetical protein GCM10008959_20330 [Deinococcus seoulensis]